MFGHIAAVVGRIHSLASGSPDGSRARRVLGVALVFLILGLSGYLAAAGGVTVDFSIGSDEADTAASGASVPAEDRPEGFVADNASATDADDDGLTDRAEREVYGTDPTSADTDGDGIPDGMEVACSAAYPDADPLRQDVYVELDSVRGVHLGDEPIEGLRETFADAPVENPSGEPGVDLHLVTSDTDLRENGSVNDERRPGAYNDVGDYRDDHQQYGTAGYYYLLVSSNVAYEGDDYYAGAGHRGTAIVEQFDRPNVMSSLTLHEMGHAFGIDGGADGVDAERYSMDEYRSVMNYNALYEMTDYSDGTDEVGRDEWAYVATDRHRPDISTPNGQFCPAVG